MLVLSGVALSECDRRELLEREKAVSRGKARYLKLYRTMRG